MDIQIIVSAILLLILAAILIAIYIYLVRKAFRMNNINGGTSVPSQIPRISRIPNMSSDDIKELPCFDYKVEEKENSPVECAVCLENFRGGEKCSGQEGFDNGMELKRQYIAIPKIKGIPPSKSKIDA
ncbi:RING-type domain-containing protein [Forsythia ovata]|uniref:RING-type domain-containing protein n=1 Tax=Forsythia ovata TaxID=205694 RepID=A0ABD1P7Q3_9LAMI